MDEAASHQALRALSLDVLAGKEHRASTRMHQS
jgi:hypothetical protein